MSDIVRRIETVIAQRKTADPKESYVASLFDKGNRKIAEKVGEEAIELVIAAVSQGRDETVSEAADLIFHMLVMLHEKGIGFADIESELARREGLPGHEEKASRPK